MRTLGRGGMATVYLAEQQSVQREVALKVMSPLLASDEQFGERFLREARIIAKLSHPHVVQVHDVGMVGNQHYIAMEYVPGGPVMDRSGTPRPPAFALRVASQIASALDYAGERGIVHRDIKPDNILLREDGNAVLTDFGIAHASDASRMTRTGTIVGTPHYMSPEQARGQKLDARADLYSLGVVLYELLVGRVPYQAADSLAIGIMHITSPLPRLPDGLAAYQPLLDRMLAKDPAQRFQRGHAVVAAIQQLQQEVMEGRPTVAVPQIEVAPDAVATQDEPTLGRIDEVLRTPSRPRRAIATSGRRWRGVLVLLVLVLLAGSLLYAFQDSLRQRLPQTRMNAMLFEAAQALEQGHLSRADGQGARELYLAVLAQDPDSQTARQGLMEVGRRLLQRAREALAQGDPAPTQALLAQAEGLVLPSADLAELQRQLHALQGQEDTLLELIGQAREAAAAGQLDGGGDSAIALYRQALAADPGNAVAAAGLREVLSQLLAQAHRALELDNIELAAQRIERVAAVDPAHLGLPEAHAALAQARQLRASHADTRLEEADALLARGQLRPPQQPNALDIYQAVLAQDPNHARAREGVRAVASALLAQAGRRIDDYHFEDAGELIAAARTLAPELMAVAATAQRMEDVRERRTQMLASRPVTETDASLETLLQRADTAAAAGNFLVPPGESAYDLYRAVLRQQPDHAQARAGLAGLPDRILVRFEAAMTGNRLGAARDALEAMGVIAPTDSRLLPARQRLARSWLAYASERLGAGEIARAADAFDQARELDPSNTDLPAIQARLEHARGG
ncbi:protein kinase [Denitratimonas sp. CY0512]|uniref:protein kinase domain-containing protein n=1 Tax=Denitratimonas sp. CY0512 TaxID=3131940 RepID=UPI0030B07132